ncbi:hypothetical protein VPH35_007746 [Triticum aestivum]
MPRRQIRWPTLPLRLPAGAASPSTRRLPRDGWRSPMAFSHLCTRRPPHPQAIGGGTVQSTAFVHTAHPFCRLKNLQHSTCRPGLEREDADVQGGNSDVGHADRLQGQYLRVCGEVAVGLMVPQEGGGHRDGEQPAGPQHHHGDVPLALACVRDRQAEAGRPVLQAHVCSRPCASKSIIGTAKSMGI